MRETLLSTVSHIAMLVPSISEPRIGKRFDPVRGMLYYPRYPY